LSNYDYLLTVLQPSYLKYMLYQCLVTENNVMAV
jgi:hypothetical protein